MGAIAAIEKVGTIKEIHDDNTNRGTVRLATLASAFGAVLRYAGSRVTDEEVYIGMHESGNELETTQAALGAIISIMIPPTGGPQVSEDAPSVTKKTKPVAASSLAKPTS